MPKKNSIKVVSEIPGSFLYANMDDNVNMLLEGTIAEMINRLGTKIHRIK